MQLVWNASNRKWAGLGLPIKNPYTNPKTGISKKKKKKKKKSIFYREIKIWNSEKAENWNSASLY